MILMNLYFVQDWKMVKLFWQTLLEKVFSTTSKRGQFHKNRLSILGYDNFINTGLFNEDSCTKTVLKGCPSKTVFRKLF